jgi:hypothetical protein
MTRPSHAAAVAALRTTDPRYPWVGPTDEEAEVASLLEEIDQIHIGQDDEPDVAGHYGWCLGCRDRWPCKGWLFGEQLALQWLGRAADRVFAHAQAAMPARPSTPTTAP